MVSNGDLLTDGRAHTAQTPKKLAQPDQNIPKIQPENIPGIQLISYLSVTLLVQLLHLSVPSISHEMFHNTSICGQSDDFIQLIT